MCIVIGKSVSLMHTTPQKAARVIALIENGFSQRAVARQLDMTRQRFVEGTKTAASG